MTQHTLQIAQIRSVKRLMLCCIALICAPLVSVFGAQPAAAEGYETSPSVQLAYATRMDYAHWHTEASRFSCKLSQDIKRYGTAVFEERAGQGSRFTLHAKRNPLAEGTATLISQAPIWAPDLQPRQLGSVSVRSGKQAIILDDRLANQMLAELQRGMAPEFQGATWYDSQQATTVGLSSKHFLGAYERYLECVEQMFSKSFEQIARTRVHFDTDKHSLNAETRNTLNEIIEYTKLDSAVARIYVDGHTDDVHESSYNIGLSKRRAKAVSAYILAQGIDKKKLVTRYHGERYPVVPNVDDESRLQNRRVTVRLER